MSPLKLNGSTSGFVALDAPAAAGSNTLVLPTGNGSNGQVLTTNGSGTLSFTTVTSSQWTTTGSDIYYTTGKVLVGTSSTLASATSNATIQILGGTNVLPGLRIQATNSSNAGCLQLGNDPTGSGTTCGMRITGDTGGGTTYDTYRSSGGDPHHAFAVNSTERMRLHSNGRLSVSHAPSAASHTLDVRNDIQNLSALGVYQAHTGFNNFAVTIDVNRATTDNTYNFLRCIQQSATDKLYIRDSGTVQNATGTYSSISDIKLKENIVDAPSQWDDIKNIRIRNYNFKPETNHQTHKQIGVIAQELQLVCPGLVEEAPDLDAEGNDLGTTTKGVKSSILYMKAVKALQEAMERIETLEANNAAFEARLAALEVTP